MKNISISPLHHLNCNSSVNTSTGDFILAAHHFGVAHPPGYPLYVSLGHIWMRLFPFGSPAYKLNFFTSIIGGVAAFILYITTYRYAVHANCYEKTDAKYMTLILISVLLKTCSISDLQDLHQVLFLLVLLSHFPILLGSTLLELKYLPWTIFFVDFFFTGW